MAIVRLVSHRPALALAPAGRRGGAHLRRGMGLGARATAAGSGRDAQNLVGPTRQHLSGSSRRLASADGARLAPPPSSHLLTPTTTLTLRPRHGVHSFRFLSTSPSTAAMAATKIDGTAIAKKIRERLRSEIAQVRDTNPRFRPSLKIIQGVYSPMLTEVPLLTAS